MASGLPYTLEPTIELVLAKIRFMKKLGNWWKMPRIKVRTLAGVNCQAPFYWLSPSGRKVGRKVANITNVDLLFLNEQSHECQISLIQLVLLLFSRSTKSI